MTGYGATIDRAWRDGVELAAAGLNEHGGVLGQKIEVITEGQSVRAAGRGDGLPQNDQLRPGESLHQRLRVGGQFRCC